MKTFKVTLQIECENENILEAYIYEEFRNSLIEAKDRDLCLLNIEELKCQN